MSIDSAVASTPVPVFRKYGHSVMFSAFGVAIRNLPAFGIAILLNAIIQALLVISDPIPSFSFGFLLVAAVSYLAMLFNLGWICSVALGAVGQEAGIGAAAARMRERLGPFVGWSVGLSLAAIVGLLLSVFPGIIVVAITPFVLLAVIAGTGSPLAANFRAIKQRFGRCLITAIIQAFILFIVYILAAVNTLLVAGAAAAFIYWIVLGFLLCWFMGAWALIFRNTSAGSVAAADHPA